MNNEETIMQWAFEILKDNSGTVKKVERTRIGGTDDSSPYLSFNIQDDVSCGLSISKISKNSYIANHNGDCLVLDIGATPAFYVDKKKHEVLLACNELNGIAYDCNVTGMTLWYMEGRNQIVSKFSTPTFTFEKGPLGMDKTALEHCIDLAIRGIVRIFIWSRVLK